MADSRPRQRRILCLIDTDQGRDVEMLLPLIYYLERHEGCQVKIALAFNPWEIYRNRPDLVLLPNTVGSHVYYQCAEYAERVGIPVFALTSEGNFRTDGTFPYWGYHKRRDWIQQYVCLWSERTRAFLSAELPDQAHKIVFTGATYFDRYQIYRAPTKAEFCASHDLPAYERVITYAGWSFGKLSHEPGLAELRFYFKNDESRLTWMENQMLATEALLRAAIEANPHTLFILKRHPNESHPHMTHRVRNEMSELSHYPNVLYLETGGHLHELIGVSDLWMAFESTTALEAWLVGNRPTIYLNEDPHFNRDKLVEGCLVAQTSQALLGFIEEFYREGKLVDFQAPHLAQARQRIIWDTIGHSDGLNHLRAAHYLRKVFDAHPLGQPPRPKFSFKYWTRFHLTRIGKLLFNEKLFLRLPKFKKAVWVMQRYGLPKLGAHQKRANADLDAFYLRENLDSRLKEADFWDHLFAPPRC